MDSPERKPAGGEDPAGEEEIRRLVARAKDGDVVAFEQLYRRFAGQVHAVCLRLVGDPVAAETLTQDAFVRAWDRLPGFRGDGPFGAWLRRLTINVVVEDRRTEGRRRQVLRSLDGPEPDAAALQVPDPRGPARPGAGAPPPADTALDLERALASLPPGARTCFVLHDVEGYRHHEIAAMTGLAVGTVKAQLHRARRLLRLALNAEPEVSGT